jgi:starvation-inducible DNA-binding protein
MTLHPTRNDLPAAARAKVAALLNQSLALALDTQLAAKQAHWNVKGPQFIALHELFDKVHGVIVEAVDELAERCVQLGGQAQGTLQAVAKASTLKPYPAHISAGVDHVRALSDRLAAFGAHLRRNIDASAGLGDMDTADLYTELSREADKYLWFVEAHLQGR